MSINGELYCPWLNQLRDIYTTECDIALKKELGRLTWSDFKICIISIAYGMLPFYIRKKRKPQTNKPKMKIITHGRLREENEVEGVGMGQEFSQNKFTLLIEVQLTYNAVPISAVQQSDSGIHRYTFFIVFSIIVYHRILNIVPCAIHQDLVVYPF